MKDFLRTKTGVLIQTINICRIEHFDDGKTKFLVAFMTDGSKHDIKELDSGEYWYEAELAVLNPQIKNRII